MITATHINAALHAAGAGSRLAIPAADIATLFNDAILNYGDDQFKTTQQVAALVSECMMESDYFRATEEYAHNGRYAPYIGRTLIQVTWKANYAAFGAWCYEKGLVTDPNVFVTNYASLAEHKWAALGGVWYFTSVKFHGKFLTEYANNIDQVGRAVNLGDPFSTRLPNGYQARRDAYAAVVALGSSIIPKPSISEESSVIQSPVPGARITLAFGVRNSRYAAGYHTGRDYGAPTGSPAYAVRGGTVVRNGYDSNGYGNWLTLRADNGRDYVYCHLSAITRTGRVRAGDQIARTGATGNVTGPHLHLEDRPRGGGYGRVRNPSWGYSPPAPHPGPGPHPGPYPRPRTKVVYDSLVKPGQRNSDSVWWVQTALNAVSLRGGRNIPLTGNYDAATVAEVKKFQTQKCGDPGDGDLGPKQTRQLFHIARINVTFKAHP